MLWYGLTFFHIKVHKLIAMRNYCFYLLLFNRTKNFKQPKCLGVQKVTFYLRLLFFRWRKCGTTQRHNWVGSERTTSSRGTESRSSVHIRCCGSVSRTNISSKRSTRSWKTCRIFTSTTVGVARVEDPILQCSRTLETILPRNLSRSMTLVCMWRRN